MRQRRLSKSGLRQRAKPFQKSQIGIKTISQSATVTTMRPPVSPVPIPIQPNQAKNPAIITST